MILSPRFSDVLDATRRDEQRTALRSLLMHPVLFSGTTAGGKQSAIDTSRQSRYVDEGFVLVRRHHSYLTHWLARYTGWTLILRSGSARLVKRTVDFDDPTRGAQDPSGSGGPLSRSRYVLWCLVLAVLHEEGRQTTLQRIAEHVTRIADSMPELLHAGIQLNMKLLPTRRSLVCVVRLLLAHGVLRRVEGDETKLVESAATDCLYNIDCGLLTDMLYTSGSLSGADGDAGSLEDRMSRFFPLQSEDVLRPREIEHRLIGRLLDNPVMYYDDLTEREFQYWQSQRSRLLQVIEEAVGLVPEVRAEGVAMLDPLGELTDVKMPDSGTVGHATLLLAEYLSGREAGRGTRAVSTEALTAHLAELARRHQTHWRKNITDASEIELLLNEVLDRLEMLRMIRRKRDAVEPLPAIHRFCVDSENDFS